MDTTFWIVGGALLVAAFFLASKLNAFDINSTRRLSLSLMGAGAAFLFSALSLIGSGISGKDKVFAAGISTSLLPFSMSIFYGLLSLICVEIAAHKSTPKKGHPHSVANYLQTAFVFISVLGLGNLISGVIKLIVAATVTAPIT